MGKKKKKQQHQQSLLIRPPLTSRREARRVTSEFHRLSARAATDPSLASAVEAQRPRYQEASALSTSLHSTSSWVLKSVEEGSTVLEIGAINTQLLDSKKVKTRAIDLRSSRPRVEAVDFFDVYEHYDNIVCSLVLNCVERRREMLERMKNQARSKVFLVIPRTCVERSAKTTPEQFFRHLRRIGFAILQTKISPKLLHLILSTSGGKEADSYYTGNAPPLSSKIKKTNDFSI